MDTPTHPEPFRVRVWQTSCDVFWWKDENVIYQQNEGRGRDVSDRGAFVFAAACPPVGTSIGLRISLEGFPDATPAVRIEV